jgi:hypothetical protein
MTPSINLCPDVYEILHRSYGETALREKVNDFLLQGMHLTLERYNRDILSVEEKYGYNFQEFERRWDEDTIADKHSYAIESDFIDWEMLEGGKKVLTQLVASVPTA